jgi:membrane associated rhomboid family serine protease
MGISIGIYSLPLILTALLGLIYKIFPNIPDNYKTLIPIVTGILFGIGYMLVYETTSPTMQMVIEYIIGGFMGGAASIGLYKTQQSTRSLLTNSN